jgi:hypothetical protein
MTSRGRLRPVPRDSIVIKAWGGDWRSRLKGECFLQPPCKLLQVTSPTMAFKESLALGQPPTYKAKKQTTSAIQRYHILCAAIQGKYEMRDIAPIADHRK